MRRFPTPFLGWGSVCSPRRCQRDTPNRCRHLGKKGGFRQHHRYSQFITGGDSPSAPVASTILATLRAKALRELSSRAATEKPVSPQPPMATKMLVPSTKASRAEETLVKRGHSVRFASKNIPERVNASTTWVMGSRRCWSVGITSCCLLTGVSGNLSKSLSRSLLSQALGTETTYPVRYIKQTGF